LPRFSPQSATLAQINHLKCIFCVSELAEASEQWWIVPKLTDSGAGVEDYLCPVDAVHEPVLWVVASVADVHGDAPIDRLEHLVSGVTLHKMPFIPWVFTIKHISGLTSGTMNSYLEVVGGFVEVSNSGYVVLPGNAHHLPHVI
jgi:hypothetical protein